MTFPIVTAESIERKQFAGRNRAVLLGCVDDVGVTVTCVVKLLHRIESDQTFWVEWVAGLIARRLGVFTPEMFAVEIGAEFAAVLEKDLRDGAAKSVGLNFGSRYIRDPLQPVASSEGAIDAHLRQQAADMAVFDVFVENPDRRRPNPNYLVEAANPPRLVAIDHDMAFGGLYLRILGSTWPLDILRDHVFARRLGKSKPELQRTRDAIVALDDAFFDGLPDQVPPAWLAGDKATTLSSVIAKLKVRRDTIDAWFPKIQEWVDQ